MVKLKVIGILLCFASWAFLFLAMVMETVYFWLLSDGKIFRGLFTATGWVIVVAIMLGVSGFILGMLGRLRSK